MDQTRFQKEGADRLLLACHRPPCIRAFTLIELVGVMAVIAILAGALVPVVVKRMDLAAYNAETAALTSMKDALTQYLVQSNTVPSQTTWAQAISAELGLAAANISTNARNQARAFLIDNSGWLGTVTLPYGQQAGGITVKPSNARLMIVSSIGKALPISSGVPGSAAFNNIWNTAWPNVPVGWTWAGGSGGDLVIQRINLEPIFHRVILVNSAGGPGYFSINTNRVSAVPPGGSGTNTYYLDGTALNLYDNTGANLIIREIIHSDMSRVYEYGLWRDGPFLGITNLPPTPLSLGSIASLFSTNAAGSGSSDGATPQTALSAMTAYMDAYTMWASMSPCFSYSGNGRSYTNGDFPPYQILEAASGKNAVSWIDNLSP